MFRYAFSHKNSVNMHQKGLTFVEKKNEIKALNTI